MLDYKLLEALNAVAEEGGFEKAARRLCLSQPAVSQRVRSLEEQAGLILLTRSVPPRPTPAGERLLRHFRQVSLLEADLRGGLGPTASSTGPFPGADGPDPPVSLSIGVNADSLGAWFLEAVTPFLERENVLLDLRVDDQERTLRFLRDGEVAGCVSAREAPVQGCRSERLGEMRYRLCATPEFVTRHFPEGLTADALRTAPAILFNREDGLHGRMIAALSLPDAGPFPAHYIPSYERFGDAIPSGLGYGMLPDQQSAAHRAAGRLVDLAPGRWLSVPLYWHCWNIRSRLLERLTAHLVRTAAELLEPAGLDPAIPLSSQRRSP